MKSQRAWTIWVSMLLILGMTGCADKPEPDVPVPQMSSERRETVGNEPAPIVVEQEPITREQALAEIKKRTQVTDAGLEHLKALINLQFLDLTDTQVSDAGFTHLKEMASLKYAHLYQTKVTDAGVNEFNHESPEVTIRR